MSTPHEIVKSYFDNNMQVVYWPDVGTQKGPVEHEWQRKRRSLEEYDSKQRVGLITGTEIESGKWLADFDIDWAPGAGIARALLPQTNFVFGRASKLVSHAFYTVPEAMPTRVFKDPVHNDNLLEFRCAREDGQPGFQTMVPPSIWADKDGKREPLEFRRKLALVDVRPAHIATTAEVMRIAALAATGMLLGRHLGRYGFGHDARLAWAGFLLRLGVDPEDLIAMGDALSKHCDNTETADVRRVVESTVKNLQKEDKKVAGGPVLAKLIGRSGNKVVAAIKAWLGVEQDFDRDKNDNIVNDSQRNIWRAIELCGVEVSYDEFSERELINEEGGERRSLDDAEQEELWLRLDREHHFRPTYFFFEKVLRSLARQHSFHPVRDYLNSLTWDQTPRIETWLSVYGGAQAADDGKTDDERKLAADYLRHVSALPLMAAVKRIIEPGCKYDEMLVLESGQGLSKSSALRALCPRDEWFSDDLPLNVGSKELIERTLGKMIIEASDLAGKRKTEIEQLKATMSRQVDGPARMAYARKPVERPRHFILIGTTNAADYLTDSTGARRFWPVRVTQFNVDAITRDRDQLWAEAYARVKEGESIRLPQRLWDAAGTQQEARREIDPWEDTLQVFLDGLTPDDGKALRVTTDALFNALGIEVARRDRVAQIRVSQIMQRLGFVRRNLWQDGSSSAGYVEVNPAQRAASDSDSPKGDEDVPF